MAQARLVYDDKNDVKNTFGKPKFPRYYDVHIVCCNGVLHVLRPKKESALKTDHLRSHNEGREKRVGISLPISAKSKAQVTAGVETLRAGPKPLRNQSPLEGKALTVHPQHIRIPREKFVLTGDQPRGKQGPRRLLYLVRKKGRRTQQTPLSASCASLRPRMFHIMSKVQRHLTNVALARPPSSRTRDTKPNGRRTSRTSSSTLFYRLMARELPILFTSFCGRGRAQASPHLSLQLEDAKDQDSLHPILRREDARAGDSFRLSLRPGYWRRLRNDFTHRTPAGKGKGNRQNGTGGQQHK